MFAPYIYDYFIFSQYNNIAETTSMRRHRREAIYLCLYLIKHTIFYASEYNNNNKYMEICSPLLSPFIFIFHYYIITLFIFFRVDSELFHICTI